MFLEKLNWIMWLILVILWNFGYPDATYSKDNYYNATFGPKYNEAGDLVTDGSGSARDIVDWRRRMVENGGRRDDRDTDVYRFVMGLEGTSKRS